ncbi:hypothetical protein [Priestia taiwanensis]|uniref:Uncharacterized protein n=1 Tax=Priestia taiwanensis TaxID=1347902 RepID=A0A917AR34_9BACI|nr:hypothetical protein [Priestia taiwanensis]MBM7363250.1 hypothetical protein [Priestia taiwanensis]GGE68899.1 hypothetical protein GCM10007140_18690 [Priestia taiwanensis]
MLKFIAEKRRPFIYGAVILVALLNFVLENDTAKLLVLLVGIVTILCIGISSTVYEAKKGNKQEKGR